MSSCRRLRVAEGTSMREGIKRRLGAVNSASTPRFDEVFLLFVARRSFCVRLDQIDGMFGESLAQDLVALRGVVQVMDEGAAMHAII